MKFVPMTELNAEKDVLQEEFARAKSFAKAKVGANYFFYPAGFCKRSYVPYQKVVWAFRRMEEMSKAGQTFTVNKLILVTDEKRQLEYLIHKDGAEYCMEMLRKGNPAVDLGYEQEKEAKYL